MKELRLCDATNFYFLGVNGAINISYMLILEWFQLVLFKGICNACTWCRCGYEFCYLCGKEWKEKAATCECRLWDEGYLLHQQAPIVNHEVDNDFVDNFEADSDDDMEFDEVDGRSNFLFVSNPVHPFYKTRLCRHWAGRGICFAGERCNFAHGTHELR